ncbi:MAG TPA: PqqD family protein [Bacteroidales bacterium]|nr:PqqD family protein [Desulfobacteraceae bacterium]HRW86662.1 PqqD family protein [Bacteroidales bacterium]
MAPEKIDFKTTYVRNENTISGRLQDEVVMMDIDKGKYFSLNPVATRIWDLIEVPLTIDELCSRLMEEYEVDAEQCQSEVTEVIDEMVKLGVVLKHE